MNAYEMAALRPVCQVARTGRDVVKLGSLSKPSVAWGRRNIAITAQDLTTGGQSITIFDLRALTLIHNNTLDDTDANIVSEMSGAFSRAIAEAEDTAFAIGAGDDSPAGVAANTLVQANYVASGVAAAMYDASNNGVDALISCMYTPKAIYSQNGTWAMNTTTEAVVRKLKDGEGRYLWQPSSIVGTPNTLLGKPIVNPASMPDIEAGTFPVVFGDFKAGYKIRDRSGMTVQRLVERYAEYDQTGFIIKKRVGGQVTLPEAFACIKIATS
jgi:HK97 family phage major capsid protein